jgi:hypothetical protein
VCARGIKKNSKTGGQTPLAVFFSIGAALPGGHKWRGETELVLISSLADHGDAFEVTP